MRVARHHLLLALLGALLLSACVPIANPFLRNVDGQAWAARFDVTVTTNAATIRIPVDLTLTFRQQGNDVTAEASLVYDALLFRFQTGNLVGASGRLGFDDSLDLRSSSGALAFDGRFSGDRLIGTVSLAGVAPVGDVVFTRVR